MKIRWFASIMLLTTAIICVVHKAPAATPADTVRESLENYIQAWNEPDTEKRNALLATAWAENATYTDPSAHVEGRDALLTHIDRFRSNPQFKGSSLARASKVDLHHETFRFEWELKDASGNTTMVGIDYGEFNEDGAITKIVGFFGPFPELK